MGCDKKKILSIEDRLAEIQARKAEIQRLKIAASTPIKTPDGEVGVSNAKGTNRLYRGSDGKVKRYITIENNEIVPQYKNLNTINGRPDELDENKINDPRLRKGTNLSVVFKENDYWKNNKWSVEDQWKEAPLYILDENGDPIEMIESYKEHKKGTLVRKEIYEALQEGKEVSLTVKDKMYNYNNMQFAGSPVFLDVKENLTPTLLKNTNGEIFEAPEEQQPILAIATGVENDYYNQAGIPEWKTLRMDRENEDVALAIKTDMSQITPVYGEGGNATPGQVAAVVLAPNGKYTIAYLSTRTLSDKAVNFVLESAAAGKGDLVNAIVGNNNKFEEAFKNPKFLNIQTLTTKKGEQKTFINFFSEGNANKNKNRAVVRIEGTELAKALNGEKFKHSVGVFRVRESDRRAALEELAKGGKPGVPNSVYTVTKNIVSLPTDGVDIITELRSLLKSKKHQIDGDLMNTSERFEIPGFTKPGGYESYQEYLFDSEAHGENFNLATDVINNTAILNTDIKKIDDSIFFNGTLTFSDMLIDGKSVNEQVESKIKTTLETGTSVRESKAGPRIRRKKAQTIEEQIAANKEKLDNCGF